MGTTVKKAAKKTGKKAKEIGGKLANAVAEAPAFLSLQRNDRAIRSEIDDELLAIGKRVRMLHKRNKAASKSTSLHPFARYKSILERLERLDRLESEYQENRVRLNEVRADIRGKGR